MRGTHRLIAIDLYGYGDTPMPADRDRFSLSDEVDLVQAVLAEALALGKRFHWSAAPMAASWRCGSPTRSSSGYAA